MKLHRLKLTNYKGVVEREINLPDSGVIVVEGPNEIGKTSLIEALTKLLEVKTSSRKSDVTAMQPVDRDVATEIEADISSGPYRFTYHKRWFRAPATELSITAPHVEHVNGLEAHQRVEQIMAETADTVLWKALRLMQATELTQEGFGASAALTEALDRAAGQANTAGDEGEALIRAVENEFLKYFTARAMNPTNQYRDLRTERSDRQDAVDAAKRALDAVQADAEAHARTRSDLAQCDEEAHRAQRERDSLQRQWTALSDLQRQVDEAGTRAGLAESEHRRARERRAERDRRATECAAAKQSHAALVVERDRVFEELVLRERVLGEKKFAVAAAEGAESSAQAAVDLLERDVAHVRALEDLQVLENRLSDLRASEEARSAAHSRLSQLSVDSGTWDRIRSARRGLDDARLEQRAASATLSVTALAEGQELDIDGVRRELSSGEVVEPPLGEALEIVVPGSLLFSFRPEAGAAERTQKVAAAEGALAAVLREAGVEEVSQAERLHAERVATEQDLKEAKSTHELLLRGDHVEDLRDRRRALADSTAAYRSDRPAEPPLPADIATAEKEVAEARQSNAHAREAGEGARHALDGVREEVERLHRQLSGIDGQSGTAERHLEEALERLSADRKEFSDDALEQSVIRTAQALATARGEESTLRQRLEEQAPEQVELQLDGAESSLASWLERREHLLGRRIAIETRLESAGGQGLQEKYDDACSELEHVTRAFDATDRRAKAARLLFTTLSRHRSEAQQAYVAPFAAAVNRLGRVVYGRDFAVEVDEQLRVIARVLDGVSIPFEALSAGAREQLAVITRLACASLIDGEQGVPVVIDDALGYSDPDRLRRLCAAFGLVDGGSQVILLTCTPGRYTGIANAHLVTLS
ncbi:MAG: AAA family ATPase [Actinomycetota bacterium]